MPWELRKKPLRGERPVPKLLKLPKLPKLPKLRKVPRVLRPPKPGPAPPGHEYYWRDE
jgi:hypothetical protein